MHKVKCLILTTSMGHESIAKSIEETLLEHKYDVKLVKESFSEVNFQYQPIYQFFPRINGSYYKIGKNKLVQRVMKKLYVEKKKKKLEKIIKEYAPDIVISTYFFYNYALGEIKKTQNFIFFNIVANPRTTHPLEYTPEAELNLVYDDKAKQTALSYDIPENRVREIGWFTSKKFFSLKSSPTKKIPTILISAGSLGTSQIAKFLPTLFRFQKYFHYVFIAGKNKALFEIFKKYQNMCNIISKKYPENKIIEFTNKMPELMQKADIIAGKAGPNLLFEAVAAGKPFLALTYIPGQEDGNLDLMKSKNLGWIGLNSKKAKIILREIVRNPVLIESKIDSINKEKRRIAKSGELLVKYIEEFLEKSQNS